MEPYRLAICEDDPLEGQHLFRVCGELLAARQIPHTLRLFSSADALAKSLFRRPLSITSTKTASKKQRRGFEPSPLFCYSFGSLRAVWTVNTLSV